MYVVAYETSSKTGNFLLDHVLSMDNVCNRCLFSIPSKVEMAEEQEYLRCYSQSLHAKETGISSGLMARMQT